MSSYWGREHRIVERNTGTSYPNFISDLELIELCAILSTAENEERSLDCTRDGSRGDGRAGAADQSNSDP